MDFFQESRLFYIIVGFFSGSILFGKIIPFLFKNVDVAQESDDGNPGAFNAFTYGGTNCGLLVLLLDLLKGVLPIWQPLILLIIWYLLFLAALPAKSNTRKTYMRSLHLESALYLP